MEIESTTGISLPEIDKGGWDARSIWTVVLKLTV